MRLPILALATALATLVAGPAASGDPRPSPDRPIHYSDKVMGTVVSVTIWGDDEVRAAEGAKAVFDEFRRVDRLMSSWREGSGVTRINEAAGGRPVPVSRELFAVLRRAQAMSKKSGGAFDITVGAFRGLWKFDEDRDGTIPAPEDVAARLPLVGHRQVALDPRRRTVRLGKRGMRITLGGIAKGHAVDRAVKLLHERDVADFILQAGGDLYVSGRRGDRKWRVGIRDPRGPSDATFALAEVEDETFSTSGDYERSVMVDGVRYHHILDPKTGRPARKSRSVTVLAKSALEADVWSTTLFILGPARGLALVEKAPGIEAVFVDAKNELHVSSGLESRLVVLRPPTAGP